MDEKNPERLITLCMKHKEAMEVCYYLEEIPGTMRKGQCRECGPHSGPTAQYRYDSKAHAAMARAMEKQRTKIDFGGYRKDTRAQYREPWRER